MNGPIGFGFAGSLNVVESWQENPRSKGMDNIVYYRYNVILVHVQLTFAVCPLNPTEILRLYLIL